MGSNFLLPPSRTEESLISELRSAFLVLPSHVSVESAWLKNLDRLKNLVLNNDPRDFLHWDVIVKTMFIPDAVYTPVELCYLLCLSDFASRWRSAIKESPFGSPAPSRYYPDSSGNLLHHAYHLAQFESFYKTQVNDMNFILEFGGGYGSMCRLYYNLGFSGRYIIFDLPELSALQRYYLKSLGLPVLSVADFVKGDEGVLCISDMHQLSSLFVDSSLFDVSMFIATWSLSEAPVTMRSLFLPFLSQFNFYLLAYQERFDNVDNIEYFSSFKDIFADVVWSNFQIPHIPGSYYLFGNTEREIQIEKVEKR